MLFTSLLITSVFVNIGLAIVLYRNNTNTKDLQFKVKAIQGWADQAYQKIAKLEETRNSLLEHVANMDKPVKPATSKKPTRRSSKKSKK